MGGQDGLLDRLRWPLTVSLVAVVAVGGVLLLREPTPPPLEIVTPTQTPREYKVYVSGSVVQPGVYAFREGERFEDALRLAGGPTADADLERVNLSIRLRDEMHVRVPALPVGPTPAAWETDGQGYDLVNLNTATEAQLDDLPGVGPVTVKRIVEHRERIGPFQRIEELLELKIVNASTFDKIKGRITAP